MPRKADPSGLPAVPHDPRNLGGILSDELDQRRLSGYDVGDLARRIERALAAGDDPVPWLDRLEATRRRADWRYREPNELPEILAEWAVLPVRANVAPDVLADRIHAAWLGRCAACILGKPVEGWPRDRIRRYLEPRHAYPPDDYVPYIEDAPDASELKPSWPETTRGRIDGAARDDDLDYTVLGLRLIERHGLDFTSDEVVEGLLDGLPFTQVFTAERVTYRNAVNGIRPPETARVRNPYREWVGALIRADIFGLVAAGDPVRAASLTHRDATTSHVGNGVYAAMWAAAIIAAGFAGDNIVEVVRMATGWVPQGSRLAVALQMTADLHAAGRSWDSAMDAIDHEFGEYGWVHSIPNVAAIAAALLWSRNDYLAAVGLAVAAGRDTDSTAATVGAIAGVVLGVAGIPRHLGDPLQDRLRSAVQDFDGASIRDLADRTTRLALAARDVAAAHSG